MFRTLMAEQLAAGRHSAIWNRTDDRGTRVAGGVYFAQLKAGGRTLQRKVVMVK